MVGILAVKIHLNKSNSPEGFNFSLVQEVFTAVNLVVLTSSGTGPIMSSLLSLQSEQGVD
jgi:hypothetical protein